LNTTLKLPIGSHYVVLQGWNQAGQIAKTPLNITVVNKAPTVKLAVTPSSGVGPLTANATASGTDPDGTIASTSIAFGDGTVASSPKAAHIYAVPGTYTVTATVKDNNGATATAKATVSVTSLTPGVFIQRPLPSSVQHNPVAITASAFGSGSRITSMRVSVDNVLKRSGSFSLSSSAIVQIGTSTQLAVALHHVLVEAWDANGKKYSSSALFQVQ
jgi:PKD repeat protein